MRICLDTSAYSAFKRGNAQALDVIQRAEEIVFPAVVLGELLAGFRIGRRDRQNLDELDRFLDSPRVRIASLDVETAQRYAELISFLRSEGRPIPTNDLWIAASAMQWGLRLLSADAHFGELPQISLLALEP